MKQSIRKKVLLAILLVTILTSCCITVVFYFRSASMIEKNYTETVYSRVRQTMESFDNSMKELYYKNIEIAGKEELQREIKQYRESNNADELESLAEILRACKKNEDRLSSIDLILPKEQIAVTSEDFPVYKREIPKEEIQTIKEMEEKTARPVMVKNSVHENRTQVTEIQPIYDEEQNILAYLLLNVEERTLYYQYIDPIYDENMNQALIYDENEVVVTGMNSKEAGKACAEEMCLKQNGIFQKEKGVIVIGYKGAFSGCQLSIAVQRNAILRQLRQMQIFLIVIVLVFLFVAIVLAGSLTRAIYRPIKKLTDTVEQVGEGDLSLRAEVETGDEIGILCREFNVMLDDIQELIQKVIEEERLKKDAELEALQYQITPHFMYNTLNSIKFAALIRGEKELGGLIGDFVELLQATISKKGTFLTVADEFHILNNYVHLQEFRYQGSFCVRYEMEEGAGGCYIPRLILQPLVENAILHGIDMKEKNGEIILRAKLEQDRLRLFVIDNGRGMTKEQIDTLLHSKAKKTNGLSAIGVPNIKERLELYYGDKGGMVYQSSENGTTVEIFLPAKKEL